MSKKYDIIALGDYSIDLIFTGLPRFPELGKDTVGTGFEMIPGEGYTSAVAMRRLGMDVGWAADFGNDEFSRFTLEQARQEGLDDSLFVHHNRPYRRISVSASFPQERAFITYYDPEPKIPAAMKALATASAHMVFVSGFYSGPLLDAALLVLRAKGMQLAMDGNSNEAELLTNPATRKAIRSVDLLFPNAQEARCLTGQDNLQDAAKALGELCPLVVVKDGANGAYAIQAGEICHVPAIPVTPLDTTGSGDCFNAGFLKAWLDGKSLEESLRWGNIAGGLSTLARGGAGYRVTVKEIEAWLKKYPATE